MIRTQCHARELPALGDRSSQRPLETVNTTTQRDRIQTRSSLSDRTLQYATLFTIIGLRIYLAAPHLPTPQRRLYGSQPTLTPHNMTHPLSPNMITFRRTFLLADMASHTLLVPKLGD